MNREIEVTAGSGNVFADLGLPEPEVLLAKARLVDRLSEIVEGRGWGHAEAAAALDVDGVTVAELLDGHLDEFSLEQLFRFLYALGQEIEILVHPSQPSNRPAGVAVTTG